MKDIRLMTEIYGKMFTYYIPEQNKFGRTTHSHTNKHGSEMSSNTFPITESENCEEDIGREDRIT